jgi:hypothetical protein
MRDPQDVTANDNKTTLGNRFTPGGPRPADKVKMVAASIETHPVGSESPNSVDPVALSADYVFPPGGRRHRSRVHRVHSGEQVRFLSKGVGRLRQEDRPGPPDQSNWITCAGWYNNTGQPISKLTTTWRVPPDPGTVASQLVYFFNGIEPADGKVIVQPVLQWGDSGADDGQNRTGPFWTVASWIVGGPDDSATHTPHIRVNTLLNRTAGGFVYQCEFEGLAGTVLPTPEMSELIWCMHTLEAYELQGNHNPPYDLDAQLEYPATNSISFDQINIQTNAPGPVGNWVPRNIVSDYGEHTTVITDAPTNGDVDIYLS